MYTGKLRPFPQSEKRTVPDHIPRPDYGNHPHGIPLSEQAVKGSSQVNQYNLNLHFLINLFSTNVVLGSTNLNASGSIV